MKHILNAILLATMTSGVLLAQAPAPAPAKPPSQSPSRGGSGASTMSVQVTDKSGGGISGVSVGVAGPVERSGVTASDGTVVFRSMRAGTYRLRFEHDGFITLERELMVRGPAEVFAALNPSPSKPAAAVTPPPPAPASVEHAARAVEPRTLSIPDFLDRNLIGSEPQKTTTLACTDAGTAQLLQVKEPLNNLQSADAEQLVYVVAGAGVVRVRGQDNKAGPGWFALIPRGVPHSIRREGRNPLIALTVSMGVPCTEAAAAAR